LVVEPGGVGWLEDTMEEVLAALAAAGMLVEGLAERIDDEPCSIALEWNPEDIEQRWIVEIEDEVDTGDEADMAREAESEVESDGSTAGFVAEEEWSLDREPSPLESCSIYRHSYSWLVEEEIQGICKVHWFEDLLGWGWRFGGSLA
jgi:hypothetical protein